MIKHKSFNHSKLWYHYRFHELKTEKLAKNKALPNYLNSLFKECPDSYFNSGPRSSSLNFRMNIKMHCIKGHELSELTKHALKLDSNLSAHSKVQIFLLENDEKSIAVETPIWLENNELNNYKEIFNSELPLTGHIDLVRIEDGKIWVWDFKPKAKDEKYAATQVYFYALMLSKRTNIPLSEFNCGYFDQDYAFIFKPQKLEIPVNGSLKELNR